MSYIEVDQSGKIEQFEKDTVVALCNDHEYSVLIPRKLKQEIFMQYKAEFGNLKYKLFSIALFYCTKDFIDENCVTVICSEYERKEAIIKAFLVDIFKENNHNIRNNLIRFGIITKHSPAHKLALSVFRNMKKPDIILSNSQIKMFLK